MGLAVDSVFGEQVEYILILKTEILRKIAYACLILLVSCHILMFILSVRLISIVSSVVLLTRQTALKYRWRNSYR